MKTPRWFSASVVRISCVLFLMPLLFCGASSAAQAPAPQDQVHFNDQTHTFRIDGGGVSYVFGVNESGELQSIYWGKRLPESDSFRTPHSLPALSSFTPPVDTTPQEFTGWGGGLYTVPDLKVTFPDGNRDLVLHYVSHQVQGSSLTIVLKDISRAVYVTLRYKMDEATGILRRTALMENKTDQP